MLTPAGILVLIKSVLLALPVYYMVNAKIPNQVLDEITSLIRRFFWGKLDKSKYMVYLAWDKIEMPIDCGGLGIRELSKINDTLILKFLWRLAAGSSALWVEVVKAKYLPKSELWLSARVYNCTNFWKAIMNQREVLLP